MPARTDVEHLLRRTEYVARSSRVDALVALPTIEAAVDDVLAAPANPAGLAFSSSKNYEAGNQLTYAWLDRMAHDSTRPIQEKMGFFWHGHLCSELKKVKSAAAMRDQLNLFRTQGLGNFRDLLVATSLQVAMLRYLDNDENKASSPNENFARELLELFVLGVGNYTEADVLAGARAWTGHTVTGSDGNSTYQWRADWHDGAVKTFMGRTINSGNAATDHGPETIRVLLGPDARVPSTAAVAANRGRPTREVAAEFLTRKLWIEFAGTSIPNAALAAGRDAAIANDFEIKPWLRAILIRPEFYTTEVKQGLVRSPVEFMTAALHATGRRAADSVSTSQMAGMQQQPLSPPNVSGWKHNGYWVNAGAMARRTDAARRLTNRSRVNFSSSSGYVALRNGNISRSEFETTYRDRPAELVDRFLQLMDVTVSTGTRQALVAASTAMTWSQRTELLTLILIAPDFHMA